MTVHLLMLTQHLEDSACMLIHPIPTSIVKDRSLNSLSKAVMLRQCWGSWRRLGVYTPASRKGG